MTDIVERLRTDVLWHMRRQNWTIAADCNEAADEIERLREMKQIAATAAFADSSMGPVALSDERIDAIADLIVKGMPEGIRGFLNYWGWRQFSRALLEDCARHYRAPVQVPLPARLVRFTLRDLKAKRKRLDGFISFGNELERAAEYDEWIAALEAYADAHGITPAKEAP